MVSVRILVYICQSIVVKLIERNFRQFRFFVKQSFFSNYILDNRFCSTRISISRDSCQLVIISPVCISNSFWISWISVFVRRNICFIQLFGQFRQVTWIANRLSRSPNPWPVGSHVLLSYGSWEWKWFHEPNTEVFYNLRTFKRKRIFQKSERYSLYSSECCKNSWGYLGDALIEAIEPVINTTLANFLCMFCTPFLTIWLIVRYICAE